MAMVSLAKVLFPLRYTVHGELQMLVFAEKDPGAIFKSLIHHALCDDRELIESELRKRDSLKDTSLLWGTPFHR